MQFGKVLASSLVVVTLVAAPMAEAKLGGSKFGGSSHSYSQMQPSGGQRLGGGNSVGMQRDSVMSNVRNGGSGGQSTGNSVPPPVPPAGNNQPGYRPGWGTVAGAAALAGAAGYAMGNHEPNGGVMPNNAGAGNGEYAGQAPINNGFQPNYPPQSSGGSWFWVLALLGACGAGFYYLSRRQSPVFNSGKGTLNTAFPSVNNGGFRIASSIHSVAETMFKELQSANNAADASRLEAMCTPALAAELRESMGGNTQVVSLRTRVVDENDAIASVHYQGVIMEQDQHPQDLNEVWHFIRNTATSSEAWQLAGIEQV